MQMKLRNQVIVLMGLAGMLLGSGLTVPADEGDARLKKRIAELEAENRSLRRIIGEIRSVLESVPSATTGESKRTGLRIIVSPGEWGGSGLADMRKVCESAGGAIASQLKDDSFAPILVERDKAGPITLYRRSKGNEYIVRLNTGGQAWAQLAFQFSHEFCHIVCNYRDAKNPQLWFEETLCECASLYSLRQMAVEWKTNPPYSNWNDYSASLASYATNRARKYEAGRESISQFYLAHVTELEKSATDRELNTYIAVRLLPLFEATPTAWQSLRYLNLGPADENSSFQAYLSGWHDRVPAEHRPFIQKVAEEFGMEVDGEAQAD